MVEQDNRLATTLGYRHVEEYGVVLLTSDGSRSMSDILVSVPTTFTLSTPGYFDESGQFFR